MAVSIANPFGNGSSFITGVFGVVLLADDMVENLVSDIDSHISEAEDSARKRVQDQAANIEGWSDISSTIDVSVSRGHIGISAGNDAYSKSIADELEFGTPDAAPIPLIRMSSNGIFNMINSAVNDELRMDVPLA